MEWIKSHVRNTVKGAFNVVPPGTHNTLAVEAALREIYAFSKLTPEAFASVAESAAKLEDLSTSEDQLELPTDADDT